MIVHNKNNMILLIEFYNNLYFLEEFHVCISKTI